MQTFGQFGLGFWNGRGLFAANRTLRRKKVNLLHKVACRNSITFVVECHGSKRKIDYILSSWKQKFDWFFSPLRNGAGGGLLCLVQKTHLAGCMYDFSSWVAGRIGMLDCWCEQGDAVKSFSAVGVHNQDLTRSEMQYVDTEHDKLIRAAKRDPLNNTTAMIGDYNLPPPFAQELRLDTPEFVKVINQSDVPERVPCKKPFQKSWERIFAKCTELEFKENNHVNIVKRSTNYLNRCFVSIPASGLICFRSTTCMYLDPISMYAQGLSDHAPIMWFVGFRMVSQNNYRMNPVWCKHDLFREHCKTKFESNEK